MSRALQPLHTRAFDLDAAKAGAPYALACGWPVEIFKWDGKNPGGPIMGAFGVDDRISTWRANGEFSIQDNPRLALVMVPLGYLDGKPVFVGDELVGYKTGNKFTVQPGAFDLLGCHWPAPPKAYPVTSLSPSGAAEYFYASESPIRGGALVDAINIALRIFVDNLTVLPDDCALRAKLVEMGWTEPKELPF